MATLAPPLVFFICLVVIFLAGFFLAGIIFSFVADGGIIHLSSSYKLYRAKSEFWQASKPHGTFFRTEHARSNPSGPSFSELINFRRGSHHRREWLAQKFLLPRCQEYATFSSQWRPGGEDEL